MCRFSSSDPRRFHLRPLKCPLCSLVLSLVLGDSLSFTLFVTESRPFLICTYPVFSFFLDTSWIPLCPLLSHGLRLLIKTELSLFLELRTDVFLTSHYTVDSLLVSEVDNLIVIIDIFFVGVRWSSSYFISLV